MPNPSKQESSADITPAARLIEAFGPKSDVARQCAALLLDAIDSELQSAFNAWKIWFEESARHTVDPPPMALSALTKHWAIEDNPARLLMVTHLCYALIVEALTKQVSQSEGQAADGTYLSEAHSTEVWVRCQDLLAPSIENLLERFQQLPPSDFSTDLFGPLYQSLVPRAVRHLMGEYFTPDWLIDILLDAVKLDGSRQMRLIDPACGSGSFLVRAAARLLNGNAFADLDSACTWIAENVVGVDINPLATLAARGNLLLQLARAGSSATPDSPQIYQGDFLFTDRPEMPVFDMVIGNPPWIAWDNLPERLRKSTDRWWRDYGLFSLKATAARHGGAKKDLAMLFVYRSIDSLLADDGRLAMVVPQSLFQSKGAGDGFRRFRLGEDGPEMQVERVDDFTAEQPFQGASNWTATLVAVRGKPTVYPVPYDRWTRDSTGQLHPIRGLAEPIDKDRPGSPWLVRPRELSVSPSKLIASSDYTARLGANSGGANGVFWVRIIEKNEDGVVIENIAERGRSTIPQLRRTIEPELLFPLIRWKDITRWRARPSAHLLLTQDVALRRGIDEDAMRRAFPKTLEYLSEFEDILKRRRAWQRYQAHAPFYSMYNVGWYTTAPVKVVWRRMDRQIRAAVVLDVDDPLLGRRPVVPQETCVLVECRRHSEAYYLSAMLNSTIIGFLVAAHNTPGGKGFGTPGMLDYLPIRRYDAENPLHEELALLARQAHKMAREAISTEMIDATIDEITAELLGLSRSDLSAIREAAAAMN